MQAILGALHAERQSLWARIKQLEEQWDQWTPPDEQAAASRDASEAPPAGEQNPTTSTTPEPAAVPEAPGLSTPPGVASAPEAPESSSTPGAALVPKAPSFSGAATAPEAPTSKPLLDPRASDLLAGRRWGPSRHSHRDASNFYACDSSAMPSGPLRTAAWHAYTRSEHPAGRRGVQRIQAIARQGHSRTYQVWWGFSPLNELECVVPTLHDGA